VATAPVALTVERGQPIFYLFDADSRTITLAKHGGLSFTKHSARSQDADDLAVTLWLRPRGKSGDDPFDGPINYPAELRLPRGA
jgi:hypothetical protein